MKYKTAFQFRNLRKRLLSVVVAVNMVATLMPIATASAADTGVTVSSGYQVQINETITGGFTHPGVGLTKATLETMRAEVQAQKEPWYSNYQAMTQSYAASKTVASSNQSSTDPSKPAIDAFNCQCFEPKFIDDGLKAYTQALMYYITGDETYRTNAMHIIRIWEQMDPAKYAFYTDAHIHSAMPLNRMVTAAEILRYSSYQTAELAWTDQDTANFTNNLITPVIETFLHDNNHFMNQHNYPLLGAIAGYIFTDNRDRYNEAVEWSTVNKTAVDQGFNGSIKRLFRLVDTNADTGEQLDNPYVQHVEMGRDQAHGGGDLTNAAIISRLLLAQGTKVDPVDGTVSTTDNGVSPYEFLNDRILAAANYFWKFMLGYDTTWTPVPYAISPDGTVRGIYSAISNAYRGRMMTANFWDLYYYYTYVKGINVAEKAPYYYEAFTKRLPSNYYYGGGLVQNWNNVDGGGDFWLYLPQAVESEGAKYLPKEQTSDALVEIEQRYTSFDNNAATMQEGDTSYVEIKSTTAGSKIVVQNMAYADPAANPIIGLKIRTNGAATLELTKGLNSTPYFKMALPDTKGQWKYVTYNISQVIQIDGNYSLLYMNVKGEGTTVDIDHMNIKAGNQLTPPAFKAGNSDLNTFSFVGAPMNLDFSATDSSSTDVIAYDIENMPQGTVFNATTGAFSWQPTQAGTYSFVAKASDGTTISTKTVKIVVASDRASAVQAAIASYNSNASYVTATLNHFKAVYDDTMGQIAAATDEAFSQQLLTLRSATEGLQLLTPLLTFDGSMDYSNIVTSTFGTGISSLVDNDNDTFTGFRSGYSSLFHILDFGINYKVSASAFGIQSRMNFVDRAAGSVVYGSNDNENWTRLTPGEASFTNSMSTIAVDDAYKNAQYRFIKIQLIDPQPDIIHNSVQNMLELGEFRIYGERHEAVNKLASVSISSAQSVKNRIFTGSTASLSFKSTENISGVQVNIQGQNASVTTTDNINWTASAVMDSSLKTGTVKFSINYKTATGLDADPAIFTTDSSSLFLVNRTKFINVPMLATVTASDSQWPGNGLTAAQVGNLLFDGNTATYGDLNTSSGAYYTVDFGAGTSVKLNEIMLMPRATYSGRLNGLIVQGSNDNASWTNLTQPLAGAAESTWYDIQADKILDQNTYRYLRVYNSTAWSGNVAEVEFYGDYVSTSATLASKITSMEAPVKDATSITLPIVPNGYTIAIKSATPAGIVATDGTITQPAIDTVVSFVFTVTKTADGTTADTGTINTVVTGKATAPKINVSALAAVTASDKQWTSTGSGGLTAAQVGYLLFDGNMATYGDLNTAIGSYYTVDFGAGSAVKLNEIKLMPRAPSNGVSYSGRMNGLIVQGSNDNVSWINLTQGVTGAKDNTWTDIKIDKILNQNNYRYLKLYNSTAWSGDVAEVEFYGDYDFNLASKVLAPDGYTLASYYLYQQEVDRIKAAMSQPGADKMQLAVDLKQAEGLLVSTSTLTADQIAVTQSMVNASTNQWPGTGTTQQNGWRAFDADTNTSTDATSNPSWILVDFGATNKQVIGSVKFYPRSTNVSRVNGAILQGSTDGTNFVNLYTINNINTAQWYSAAITNNTAFRYFRYYTSNGNANVAELQLYQKVKDKTLLTLLQSKAAAISANNYTAESYAALQTAVTAATSVSVNANATQAEIDAASASLKTALEGLRSLLSASVNPAAPNGLNGWYTVPVTVTLSTYGNAEYNLNGEAAWHSYSSPITLEQDGAYTLNYRLINTATAQTITVNIDMTAPADATLSANVTAPTNTDVTVAISYPDDAAVKEYKLGASGSWTAYTSPVVVSTNDTVYARGTDAVGNVSNVTNFVVSNIDHIAPADATLTVDKTAPTNTDVTITISYPADAAVKEYKLGASGTWTTYNGPIVISNNGPVYARGTDNAGNVSNVTNLVISNINKIAPVTVATLSPFEPSGSNGWYKSDVTVSLSVSDNVYGGGTKTEYQVNNGGWITYTGSIPAFGEGIYKFDYHSIDQAGNVETVKTIEFKNDKSVPLLNVQLDKTTIWPANHKMVTIHATLNSSDAISGIASVVLTSITSNEPNSAQVDIAGNIGTAANFFSLRAEKGRIYTITYTATDKAGNQIVNSVTVTVPHDQYGDGNNNQLGNH